MKSLFSSISISYSAKAFGMLQELFCGRIAPMLDLVRMVVQLDDSKLCLVESYFRYFVMFLKLIHTPLSLYRNPVSATLKT